MHDSNAFIVGDTMSTKCDFHSSDIRVCFCCKIYRRSPSNFGKNVSEKRLRPFFDQKSFLTSELAFFEK